MTLSLTTGNNANNYYNNNVVLNPLEMCRVCLSDRAQVYTDVMGPDEPHLVQYVKEYYKVEITGDEGKSTKLCQYCLEHIDVWRGQVEEAKANQVIVNYLAEKTYMSPALAPPPQIANKRSLFVSNKKKKITPKRAKRKKRSSPIPEHETQSSSSSSSIDMIQSPSESIEQSASASIHQFPSIDTESMQYEPDFPSTSNSKEIVPFASTSTEIIPFASTSTESIPLASTSTEIIQIASTSTEIIPSYTMNEILPAETFNPTWISMDVDHERASEMFAAISSSFKAEFVCIFCTYQNEEVSRNVYKHILFCSKHSKPYACLIEDCHSVFPNKEVFIPHYRTHLKLSSSTCLCHKCFGVLTCSRRSIPFDHVHQNLSDSFKCCSLTFPSMVELVLHKLINHCAIVVTSNNRSRTLQKPNLTIKKMESNDLKGGFNVPDNVPHSEIIIDNGSIKCNYCPDYFNTVLKYIDHSLIKHRHSIKLKEKGIKLCPLCEYSYFNEQFSEHIEHCTNTLRVGTNSLNSYGCIHCKFIFTDTTPREIRNHVLYCKSFKLGIINNKLHQKCNNCTFTSTDDDTCMEHANSNCLYFQLKMRYAMGPDEKDKVEERMKFAMQNTQQGANENENDEELASSNTVCNTARQKLLKFYNFYCNNCEKRFFDMTIFFKHLTVTGSYCRLQHLIYCQKCLTEFKTVEEYQRHLPSMPESSPLLSIKQEVFDQNNDEDGDIHMDVVRVNHSFCHVKVEMNDGTYVHKQEPSNFYETSNLQYQEQDQEQEQEPEQGQEQEPEQEQEQEQEDSNVDYNNGFACQEMELTNGDIYMQCEVEDKPDLNKLLIENVE